MSNDIIVIGGGVNALTAASYLAKAGRKVTIYCEENEIGGLCARHEFHPGYTSPGILNDTSMFRNWIINDLGLQKHGLSFSNSKILAFGKDQQITISNNVGETSKEIAKISSHDADNYNKMMMFYDKIKGVLGG